MASVVIAPDSFKGSLPASDVARAIAEGWSSIRPKDTVFPLPMADGGEGTLDAVASVRPDATVHLDVVSGPDGSPVQARWLQFSDSTALIEMAEACGLPLLATPDPLGATSRGLGELISLALERGATRILVGLGGSATSDAGMGALEALGATISRQNPADSGALAVTSIDTSGLPALPPEGITLLVDTRAVLSEAATVFSPQKGANPEQVSLLIEAFESLTELTPQPHIARMPGSGAAGGVAWALASFLGAVIVEGSRYLGNMLGAGRLLETADAIVTGEGRFDETSLSGKVVGYLHHLASTQGVPGAIVVGTSTSTEHQSWPIIRLDLLAESPDQSFDEAYRLAKEAGAELAKNFDNGWGAWTRTKNN